MSNFLQPITACLKKADKKEDPTTDSTNDEIQDVVDASSNAGIVWRLSSHLYNLGSGAVGMGVGSVKWAASTTYNVGSGVVSATQTVVGKVIPSAVPKPKKE